MIPPAMATWNKCQPVEVQAVDENMIPPGTAPGPGRSVLRAQLAGLGFWNASFGHATSACNLVFRASQIDVSIPGIDLVLL